MILCGRYSAARDAAEEGLAAWPVSQACLQAEACWRAGELNAAMTILAMPVPSHMYRASRMEDPAGASESQQRGDSGVHESEDFQHADHSSEVNARGSQQRRPGNSCSSVGQELAPSHPQPLLQPGCIAPGFKHTAESYTCHHPSCDVSSSRPATNADMAAGCSAASSTAAPHRACPRPPRRGANIQHQEGQEQRLFNVSSRCRELHDFLRPLCKLKAAAGEAHEDGTALTSQRLKVKRSSIVVLADIHIICSSITSV